MTKTDQLGREFRSNIEQSLAIAQFMEKGQADTPYVDLFRRLERESNSKPLGITLLALTEEARSAALKWLYGHNFAVVSLEVSKQIGLLEIQLKEQGYFLEKSTGERLEFDDWSSFQQAVQDAELFKNKDKNELTVGTEALTAVSNVQVLLPESSAFILDSPALLTRVITESNLLMVAAPPDYQLTETDALVIQQLLEDISAFWPVLPVDELAGDLDIPEHGWWDRHKSLVSLPPTLLTTHIDTAIPPQLSEVDDELRRVLQLSLAVKKHLGATEALSERYEEELRRLQSRKKREQRKSAGQTPPSNTDMGFWSQLRSELTDDCSQFGKQLQEASRKRELPASTNNTSLKQHVDGLNPADLKYEQGYKTIKLSLGDDYYKALTQFIQHSVRQDLKEDVAKLQQQITAIGDRLSEKCHKQLGYRPNLSIPAVDESGLWRDVKDMIGLELRYQGEIPKRGFIDRLSAGRKGAMMLLMSVMLLGYIGIDLRNSGWMGILLLPIFFGAVIYTYISFRKDEEHRMEKELTRVREEVLSNSRRLLSDIARLKQSKLGDYLDQLKKQWLQQLEQLARDHQARQQAEREQASNRARSRISAIENQLNEWQRYRTAVQNLMASAEQLRSRCRDLVLNFDRGALKSRAEKA